MNPKVSDFGLARTFGGDQTEGNAKRVWLYGTEYAIDGLLPVKSDLFSFVGRKNRGLYHPTQSGNLVEHRQYKMTALKLHKN
ncbi:hypothetical protein QQP08_021611 [Theobroma cacao]|nr:hypothetical protein QQP08_021611 [Theobroma cacao]